MTSPSGAMPDAAGDFRRYPFPRLVYFLFKKKLLGHLALRQGDKWSGKVYFRDGLPVRADIPSSHDVLGRVLLERGVIDEEAYSASLRLLAEKKGLQGRILMDLGKLSEKGLSDGLRVQLHRKLVRLFPLTDVTFELYSGDHTHGVSGEDAEVRGDPYWLVYHGVRHFYTHERMAPELGRLKDRKLAITPQFAGVKARYGLGPETQGIVLYLERTALSLAEILRMSDLSPVETEMLVYALWITESLTPESAAARATSSPGATGPHPRQVASDEPVPTGFDPGEATPHPQVPAPEPPGKRRTSAFVANTAQAVKHRRLIRETHERIQNQNHYQVLAVTQKATTKEVRDAYFKLAKTFHPDRCAALGVTDVAQQAEEIFRRISEANAVLTNKDSRTEYDQSLEGKTSKQEVMNALEAEFVFQKGLFYLRKKDYAEALKHFQEAYTLNPNEGDHLAYQAWTLFNDPKQSRFESYPKIAEMLEEARGISPRSADVHYFLGELEAAKGNDKDAAKYFDDVLEINPEHLEAERHLRLIRIRQDKRKASAEKGKSFFSKLLAKDEPEDKKKGKNKKKKPKRYY